VKQNNWQLSLIFNSFRSSIFIFLVCLIPASNSEMPHFKQQQNNSTSAKVYRSDSFNKIYDNHNRFKQLQEIQLAAELAKLIVIQKQLNSEVITQNLGQNLPVNNSTTEFVTDNKIHANTNTSSNSEPDPKKLQTYPAHYNPFAHGNLNEFIYGARVFLKSRYREAQEIKYPYLADRRQEREQQAQMREQLRKQAVGLDLIRAYNRRLNRLHQQANSSVDTQNIVLPYSTKIPEQFFNTKFNNSAQQLLQFEQIDIVCELADRKIFPKNILGLQDFTDTVLETVSLAYQANCQNLINITKSLTELAQNFLALGRGLVRSGGNFIKAGSNLILHPVKTGVNLWQLTKNLTVSLGRAVVTLASYDPDADIFSEQMEIESEYTQAKYHKFINFLEVTPRIEKFEKIGEVLGDQLLSIATTLVAGKAITLISDAALAAKLQQAIVVKNKVDKTKSAKISWLNKFGVPGKDAAQTLGLVVTEEYELATLEGLIVSFKNNPANNQTLFSHAEEYLKHNKFVKKTKKSRPKITVEIAPKNTISTVSKQELLNEVNPSSLAILKNGYYEVNGFKFTEYYYNRLWDKKRGAPTLIAKEILAGNPIITLDRRSGFFRYELDRWEMIYNPITKEIHHIQPIRKRKG
jgi:hypothetical protein